MEINPFNPYALDVPTCEHDCWRKWGEAERNDTLLLTLERGLFKFSAPAPPLEVLLKLEPRIGTASPLLTAYSHNIKSRCYPAIYHCFYLQHRRFQPCCRSVIYNTRQSCTLFHLSFLTIFHICALASMVSCLVQLLVCRKPYKVPQDVQLVVKFSQRRFLVVFVFKVYH